MSDGKEGVPMDEQTTPVKNNKARNDGLAAVAAFALAAVLITMAITHFV